VIPGLGLPPPEGKGAKTASGLWSVDEHCLQQLTGDNPEAGPDGCGTAFQALGQKGCVGLAQIGRSASIRKALSTFLEPLAEHADPNGRVHTSLAIQTGTGRLTSSNPNLQQLPAMERDHYRIRRAVACGAGDRLVVADYGQLDLRVLAHLSRDSRMVSDLCSGIDIHSGTAYHMYDHVRQAVDSGLVALRAPPCPEGGGAPPGAKLPLVKDRFAAERRHAKAVNFGIAYGLTAVGLALQLDIKKTEAEEIIQKWYEAYPAVRAWKVRVLQEARLGGRNQVRTLLGRIRRMEDLDASKDFVRGRAERQAVNACVQGGSADIVVEAMLKADASPRLRELGYKMILQVHDELIFEGPAEHAAEALELVRDIMEHPFLDDSELLVPLPVDAKISPHWDVK